MSNDFLRPAYAASTADSSTLASPTSYHSEYGYRSETAATSVDPENGVQPATHNPGNGPQFDAIRASPPKSDGGWPLLADLMVKWPEFEAFSRFQDLNVKNILYYQVELYQLKQDIEYYEQDDCKSNDPTKREFLREAGKLIDSDSEQWKLVKKLRGLLNEYNEALLQYAKVSELPGPSESNMRQLARWIREVPFGNYTIKGDSCEAWGQLFERPPILSFWQLLRRLAASLTPFSLGTPKRSHTRDDLVSLRPQHTTDGLTRWIKDELIPAWHSWRHASIGIVGNENGAESGDLRVDEIACYSRKTILKVTSGITTLVACLLPTVAIAVLSTATTMRARLLLIGGFTALFSIGLMVLTSETTKINTFATTAAFSAVLVVFVQNQ